MTAQAQAPATATSAAALAGQSGIQTEPVCQAERAALADTIAAALVCIAATDQATAAEQAAHKATAKATRAAWSALVIAHTATDEAGKVIEPDPVALGRIIAADTSAAYVAALAKLPAAPVLAEGADEAAQAKHQRATAAHEKLVKRVYAAFQPVKNVLSEKLPDLRLAGSKHYTGLRLAAKPAGDTRASKASKGTAAAPEREPQPQAQPGTAKHDGESEHPAAVAARAARMFIRKHPGAALAMLVDGTAAEVVRGIGAEASSIAAPVAAVLDWLRDEVRAGRAPVLALPAEVAEATRQRDEARQQRDEALAMLKAERASKAPGKAPGKARRPGK